jgi:hypothetical protein
MAWADSWMNPVHRGVDGASIGARIKFVEDLRYKWAKRGDARTRSVLLVWSVGRTAECVGYSVGRLSRGFVPVVLALFALANWVLGLRKVVCLLMSGLAA